MSSRARDQTSNLTLEVAEFKAKLNTSIVLNILYVSEKWFSLNFVHPCIFRHVRGYESISSAEVLEDFLQKYLLHYLGVGEEPLQRDKWQA